MERLEDILNRVRPLSAAERQELGEREMQRRANIAEADRNFNLGLQSQGVIDQYRQARMRGEEEDFAIGLSGLPLETRQTRRFSTFAPRRRFATVGSALEAVQNILRPGTPPLLTLASPPGTGKTHLLLALGWELVERGNLVLYRTQPGLIEELRRSFEDRAFESAIASFLECSWLLLDDIGVEGLTDWGRGILDRIIDHRWLHLLPLVVATNAKAADLPPRLADRLADKDVGVVVQIAAPSYRSRKE